MLWSVPDVFKSAREFGNFGKVTSRKEDLSVMRNTHFKQDLIAHGQNIINPFWGFLPLLTIVKSFHLLLLHILEQRCNLKMTQHRAQTTVLGSSRLKPDWLDIMHQFGWVTELKFVDLTQWLCMNHRHRELHP